MPNPPASTPAHAPWSQREWLLGLVLLLAVFLAYTPVRFAGFIWDDDVVLTGNPVIVGPLGLKDIWTSQAADICPLTLTSFWVEHQLWGSDPLPYHLVTVALHTACAILLWRVLLALAIPGAWLGAALWALHPVQVETVAWITEMKNTQSTVFYLLAILFSIRWLKEKRERNYLLTLLCAALAMASKSSTIVLPGVLGLCAWWIEGRWTFRECQGHLARLAPIALMAVIPCVLTLWTQKQRSQGPEALLFARSWPERVATAGDAIWFYLGKLIWPHQLVFIYPRWQVDASSVVSYLPLVAAVALFFLLWRNRNGWARPTFFAYAYFVGTLVPVLGFIDGYFWIYSLVSDHFQYLASMGPLALAGAGLTRLADFALPGKMMIHSRFAALLLLGLAMLSWQRAWIFESHETIWTDTLAHNPGSWMAHNNLGDFYLAHGRIDLAREQYEQALEINPQADSAHSNLGIILAQEGQPDAAIAQFQDALKIRGNSGRAINNLAVTLESEGRTAEALDVYQKAEAINPYFPEIHYNIGSILLKQGHPHAAIPELQEALRLQPDDAEAREKLAEAQAALRPH
jgi:cytochrome c-type biogenesis protein CcmH/NrfG